MFDFLRNATIKRWIAIILLVIVADTILPFEVLHRHISSVTFHSNYSSYLSNWKDSPTTEASYKIAYLICPLAKYFPILHGSFIVSAGTFSISIKNCCFIGFYKNPTFLLPVTFEIQNKGSPIV